MALPTLKLGSTQSGKPYTAAPNVICISLKSSNLSHTEFFLLLEVGKEEMLKYPVGDI
jgi:hypothetical protein